MENTRKTFGQVVADRLEELGTNAFAIENAAGLKRDAIRSVIRPDNRQATPRVDTPEKICEALGLEFYVGPYRPEPINAEFSVGADYSKIRMFEAELSAGAGRFNDDFSEPSWLAFRSDWLAAKGLRASDCVLLVVRGDSMEPTICNGDLVMVDTSRKNIRDHRIFAFVDNSGDACVKRLEQLDGHVILHSDNRQYRAEIRPSQDANQMTIIGQVVWSGHDFER